MEVADALSPLSPESQNPIPEMNVQIHTIFFQFRNIMFENIKVQTRTKLAALYSATKSLQNSCTAKLQLFSSVLEAKQQLNSSCSGMQKRCAALAVYKSGTGQGDIGIRVWGLGDARQRTCRGQQVWDAGTCGTGTRDVKYKDVGTSNTGTWGM